MWSRARSLASVLCTLLRAPRQNWNKISQTFKVEVHSEERIRENRHLDQFAKNQVKFNNECIKCGDTLNRAENKEQASLNHLVVTSRLSRDCSSSANAF